MCVNGHLLLVGEQEHGARSPSRVLEYTPAAGSSLSPTPTNTDGLTTSHLLFNKGQVLFSRVEVKWSLTL